MPKSRKPRTAWKESKPPIPTGLVALNDWAKSKGLSRQCVHRWTALGRITTYRIPGYGLKSFVKLAEADRAAQVVRLDPPIAR